MKNQKIEILAPAGNFEALRAAIFAGADAVYLGGASFSARAGAVNFSAEELTQAVSFAKIRGVKVYAAFNTLIKDSEIPEAVEYAAFLAKIGVDAVIVQDMGLFSLLRRCCKDMPVHCSTQMSLTSPSGVALLKGLGASRAVLARELTLEEIKEIHSAVDIELEAFVHGALCMSVSGQCYFSAMLGSRSGNRGRCAGTCRLPFKGSGDFSLSLKDLSFIDEIERLKNAGVCSAKIEGRLKRPEYVAAASRAAFLAANNEEIPVELENSLRSVFSRSGFTKGYLLGERGGDMFGIRTKEDASTKEVYAGLHSLYKNELQRVSIGCHISVITGELPCLTLWDEKGNRVKIMGESVAEAARNKPLDEAAIKERVSKLGGTPYFINEFTCSTDGQSALSAAAINELKRQGVQELNRVRGTAVPYEFTKVSLGGRPHQNKSLELRAEFESFAQVPKQLGPYALVYLPWTTKIKSLDLIKGARVGISLPRVIFGMEEKVKARIKELISHGYSLFLCQNLSAVQLVKEQGGEIHGGFGLNITNEKAVECFEGLGATSAELSFELSLKEAGAVGGNISRGIMVYGRQALMLVRCCPVSNGGCGCGGKAQLTDRLGAKFPVLCHKLSGGDVKVSDEENYTQIFNSLPLTLAERLRELKSMDFGILRFTTENEEEISAVTRDFEKGVNSFKEYTRGLFYRGVI